MGVRMPFLGCVPRKPLPVLHTHMFELADDVVDSDEHRDAVTYDNHGPLITSCNLQKVSKHLDMCTR